MKLIRIIAFAAAIASVGCEGLTFVTNPDGSISGSYHPPVKPAPVEPAK